VLQPLGFSLHRLFARRQLHNPGAQRVHNDLLLRGGDSRQQTLVLPLQRAESHVEGRQRHDQRGVLGPEGGDCCCCGCGFVSSGGGDAPVMQQH